jgi:hypothetical protein
MCSIKFADGMKANNVLGLCTYSRAGNEALCLFSTPGRTDLHKALLGKNIRCIA